MVHGELIKTGQTAPLTFKELRKLERMDAKKAREQALLKVAQTSVEAGGRAAQGLFSNQIAGTLFFFLVLASNPELLAVAYANFAKLVEIVADAFKRAIPGLPPAKPPGPNPFDTSLSPEIRAVAAVKWTDWISSWGPYMNLVFPGAGSGLIALKERLR